MNIEHATILVGQSNLLMEAIASILDNTEFKVVARACSVDRLGPGDLQHKTILLILDDCCGVNNAVRQVKAFRQLHEDPRVAVITRATRVADVVSLFWAGANVCCDQGTPSAIFLRSLEQVMLGDNFLPAARLSLRGEKVKGRSSVKPLSLQELNILRYLTEGHSNKIIASKLGTTSVAVRSCVKSILRKLGVENRTQAAVRAMRSGLVATSQGKGDPLL